MNARQYAYDVLLRVFMQDGYAGLLLRKQTDFDTKDQAFISALVYGTIRNKTMLESYWSDLVNKRVRPKIAVLLNMSVYQLFYMDKVPEYAVLSEAVNLAGKHEKGFVNAVLRKVVANGKKDIKVTMDNADVVYSHPKWLLQLWKAHYGEEVALKIAEYDQLPSVVYGRVNTLKIDKEVLEQDPSIHFVNNISFQCDEVITHLDYFKNGEVVIQDIHSAQVVEYLHPLPNERILDVCSAPGTKTQQIAMMMKNQGEVVACDLYPGRVRLIEQLMADTGVTIVSAMVKDATKEGNFEEESFDRVLIDAPCSGLGDLSHKPEIRWHLKPENLDEIVETQRNILDKNAVYVKKNGTLVYSTCTLNRKENELQVAAFLKRNPNFSLLEEKTMFPFDDHGDGFYVALMKRN